MARRVWILSGVVVLIGVTLAGELLLPRPAPAEPLDGTILSAGGDEVLRRACFDCHSDETRYPWYAHLPVASLLIGHHVAEGREHINLSTWGTMSAEDRAEAIEEIAEEVEEGEMPPGSYVLLHPEARLDEAARLLITAAGEAGLAAREVAVYSVPGLTASNARDMAEALNALRGVVLAAPDFDSGRISVTFEPPTINPDAVLTALRSVDPQATTLAVRPSSLPSEDEAPGHEPGAYPSEK